MKTFLFAIMFFFSFSVSALSGTWKFTEMIYHNVRQPLLNPDLNLQWTFFANGTERLYWDHLGSPGFCERFATYQLGAGTINEQVFALNPNNNAECATDSDMQMGRKTINPIQVSKKEILIHFNLGDEEIVYVLTPQPSNFSY